MAKKMRTMRQNFLLNLRDLTFVPFNFLTQARRSVWLQFHFNFLGCIRTFNNKKKSFQPLPANQNAARENISNVIDAFPVTKDLTFLIIRQKSEIRVLFQIDNSYIACFSPLFLLMPCPYMDFQVLNARVNFRFYD